MQKRKKKNLSNDDVNSNKDSSVSGMMCMRKRVRVDLGNWVEKYVILFSNADYSPILLNLLSSLSRIETYILSTQIVLTKISPSRSSAHTN